MNSLPAWWTSFGHPDFRKQKFFLLGLTFCILSVGQIFDYHGFVTLGCKDEAVEYLEFVKIHFYANT